MAASAMSGLGKDRWEAISPHLDRALEMGLEERRAWIAALRVDDPALASALDTLLKEGNAVDEEGFLQGPLPPRPPTAAIAGQAMGAYTLVSVVGCGGMGQVWLARRSDGHFAGQAAVKILNADVGEERFKREANILARLTHPHIAHLIDAGVSPAGQPYLVLEYVDGERIDGYCDNRRLGVEARLRLFLDVLAAVAHAHTNLIVHRDIKPSNIMVNTDGRVKLLDFGIAKLLEAEAGGGAPALTLESGRALTPEYAAPEQVTAGAITTATDVYALGLVLYVLLTGRHPMDPGRASPAELVKAIVDTDPPRLSEATSRTAAAVAETAARRGTTPERLHRMLSGDLDTIVAKALKKRAEERYASVTALADDVSRYLDHKPIAARPDTLRYRTAQFVRRHPGGVASAMAMALLLSGLVAFHTARLAAERDRARVEAQKAAKVSEVLEGLLTAADPYAASKEPTVRGLLDAAAERLPKELAGQPEVQQEMLGVMGRVYDRLGLFDKAKPLLEEALAISRRVHGPEHERVAQGLHDLGVLRQRTGDLTAATSMLEEALAMRRRLLGPEHKDVADTLDELALLYANRGEGPRESVTREALAIRRKVLGEEHRDTVSSLNTLGLLLLRNGDVAGGEPLLRRALEGNRKLLGEGHPDVATALGNVALAAGARGDHAEAESLQRQALSISRKALGDHHLDVGVRLHNLAWPLREAEKYDEAAAALEEALAITRPALGADHLRTVMFTMGLALVRLEQGQAGAAEPMLRHALQVRQRRLPPDDYRVGSAKSLLGGALTKLRRYDEAETLLIDAHRILAGATGTGAKGTGGDAEATRTRLVALYEAWGRPEQADRYRARALGR